MFVCLCVFMCVCASKSPLPGKKLNVKDRRQIYLFLENLVYIADNLQANIIM